MITYADALVSDDSRFRDAYDIENEAHHAGTIVVEDPFPRFAELQRQAPVHRGKLGELMGYGPDQNFHFHIPGRVTYTAFSFAACNRALLENQLFSSAVYDEFESMKTHNHSMINRVGAEHRMLRAPIQPMFTPEAARTWWSEKAIEDTVNTLLDRIAPKKSADLLYELCARMPVHIVSVGMGISPEDIVPFRIAVIAGGGAGMNLTPEERAMRRAEGHEIMTKVIRQRRENPCDDIISRLVTAEVTEPDGTKRMFTDDEIIDNCRLIVNAGGGTTWRQLGITLYALLENPDQLQAVRDDRSLIPQALLESARWMANDTFFPRRVTQDVVLEGVEIPEGAMLLMVLAAANRDPTRWSDPDSFDIFRELKPTVAFGGGAHVCLGQHVSRQEMKVALNAVLDRLPNLRWDPSRPRPRISGSMMARGMTAVPVVFD